MARHGTPQSFGQLAISPDDLPMWMRPRRRLPDFGALIVLAFVSLIAVPLIFRSGVPPHSAAPLHALRAAESAQLMRQGILYARWASGFHFTYGAPVLNYLPPLPHTLAALHQIITDATPTDSVKLVIVAAWLSAGLGMYVFGRGRFGVRGGVLAALTYLFSAPLAFSVPYQLGEVPYLLALGLLPCAAAALDALWRAPNRRAFALALFFCAAFALCDARLTLFGGVVLCFVALSGRHFAPPESRRQAARLVALLPPLLVALTAFYWLPALAERDAVRWLSAAPPPYAAPLPLTESLFSAPYYDLSAQNPPLFRGVGIGSLLMACLGLMLAARQQQAGQVGVFAALAAALLGLATPAFAPLWQAERAFLPILPYHALLAATFCLAVTGGGAGVAAPVGRRAPFQLGALALLLILPMLGAFFPPLWAESNTNAPFASLAGELSGYHAASLRDGVLLPASVSELPRPLPNLIENLQAGRPVDRVNRATLGGRGQISPLDEGGLTWRYIVNTLENSLIEFFVHSGLGWRARLQNEPLPLGISPNGFMQVALPATNAELTFTMGGTPARDWAWAVTAVGLFSALSILWWLPTADLTKAEITKVPHAAYLTRGERAALLAVLLLMQGAAFVVRAQPELILPRSGRGQVLGEMTPLPRFSQAGIDLIGYHLPRERLQRGERLDLTLYWQAARPLLENDQSELRLIDVQTGEIVASSANRHIGGVPTLFWRLSGYLRDDLSLTVPLNVPPGSYLLKVILGACTAPLPLPCDSLRAVDAYNALGRLERGGIVIPHIIRLE
jgi:hypothetical protein